MSKANRRLLAFLMVMVLCAGLIPSVYAATDTWTVIGTVNGTDWNQDFEMIPSDEENVLITRDTFEMTAGMNFKIRKNKDWSEAYPGDNYLVPYDGQYRISFNTVTHEIKLVWAGEGEAPSNNVWSAIGTMNNSSWGKDFLMVESEEENVFITSNYFLLSTNDAFKIRLNGEYKYPENDYQVTATGVFYITFNTETTEIGLKPLENQQWGVCGSMTNWGNDAEGSHADYPLMESDTENVLTTQQPLSLKAGDKFKVRLNGSWDISYGAYNAFNGGDIQVTTAGDYYITFNLTTHQISLVAYVEPTEPSVDPTTSPADPTEPTDPEPTASEPTAAPSQPQPTEPEPTEPPVYVAAGNLAGSNWDTSFQMEQKDGLLLTKRYFELQQGQEFKIHDQYNNWYPGSNYRVQATGIYYISFDPQTKEVGLVPVTSQIWGVCGQFTNWGEAGEGYHADYPLVESDTENVLVTEDYFHLAASDRNDSASGFKIRLNNNWDICYGGDGLNGNFMVETEGEYRISFNKVTHEIKLIPRVTTPDPTEPTDPEPTEPEPTTAPSEPTTAPSEPTTAPTEPEPTEPTAVPTESTVAPTESTPPEPTAPTEGDWGVCGQFTNWGNSGVGYHADYLLVPGDNENILITEIYFSFAAGDQLKVRLDQKWDVCYGGDGPDGNFVVPAAGTYYVTFNTVTHEIGLVAYTAPTEPTVAPTEPAVPTEPTTAPTEPTTAPTEPTTAPTEPTTAPTEPTAEPTEPTAAPTEPTTAPTEPTAAPTEPTTAPTEPTAAPTEPTTAPTEPTVAPTEPTAVPSQPSNTMVIGCVCAAVVIAGVIVLILFKKKKA